MKFTQIEAEEGQAVERDLTVPTYLNKQGQRKPTKNSHLELN